jgi:hypothetical protein
MPDDFNKTLKSDMIEPIDSSRNVSPAMRISFNRIERKKDPADENDHMDHKHRPYSELSQPAPELWSMVIEAVERFNDHQEIKNTPYAIRIWAQGGGFRVQVINEETGELVKQTKLINFKDVSGEALNSIINSLIGERGVVIDVTR